MSHLPGGADAQGLADGPVDPVIHIDIQDPAAQFHNAQEFILRLFIGMQHLEDPAAAVRMQHNIALAGCHQVRMLTAQNRYIRDDDLSAYMECLRQITSG